MTTERIGYRRLYDSIGCSLADRQDFEVEFTAGSDLGVRIYLGPRPKFGITVRHSDKYVVPGEQSLMLQAEYKKNATESSYPRRFFLEIFCWKDIDVSEEISKAFRASEKNSHNELLKLAEQEAEVFRATTDLIAGTIGLRFHRQFVIELINENFITRRSDEDWPFQETGPSLEMLEQPSLNPTGCTVLENLLTAVGGANEEARQLGALVMSWLIRAWTERDTVSKFVALFIPLEIVLEGYGSGSQQELKKLAKALRSLIQNYDGERKGELLEFVNHLMERQRPTLQTRFEELAAKAQLDGWKGDIEAFKQFNKIRNALLHRGVRGIRMLVSVSDTEVRQLEDIVERYVCYSFFKDDRVYPSRWRQRLVQDKGRVS